MPETKPPRFNGKREAWSDFKLLFRAWLRRQAAIPNLETATLNAIDRDKDKSKNIELADYITLAVPKRERAQLMIHKNSGVAMWRALVTRYETMSLSERTQVQEELREIRLLEGEDIEQYIANKLQTVARLVDAGETWGDEAVVMELLRGVGAPYNSVREAMQLDSKQRTVEQCTHQLRVKFEVLKQGELIE